MNDYLYAVLDLPADWKTLLLRPPFTWLVPLVLALLALWLLHPWYQRRRAERRVRTSIQRLGKAAMEDVSLDNGVEGFVFIDYLVLTPKEILVVTLMTARGIIFGGEKIESWARVVGRRTYKFPNPLEGSQERVLAVQYHVPDVPVTGAVLFDEGCGFPKGKPDGALLPQEITTEAEQMAQAAIPPKLQAAWDKLGELAKVGGETYSRDVLLLRGNPSHARETAALVLVLVAAAWTGWTVWQLLR